MDNYLKPWDYQHKGIDKQIDRQIERKIDKFIIAETDR